MTSTRLLLRGLRYYWRTNLAMIAGVATAVAVLAGALLVGDSVRGSLRDLVRERLGRTDRAVLATGFFREALADDVRADPAFGASFSGIVPLIAMQGLVTDQSTGKRAARVQVYGVDDRFWRFHGIDNVSGPADGDAFVSEALASDISATAGGSLLVRIERPSAIPIESLQGRKDDPGRTLRLVLRSVLPSSRLGEFSISPQQGPVRAVFVPLERLQQDLDQAGRVNVMLVADRDARAADAFDALLKRRTQLGDFGLRLRVPDERQEIVVESQRGFIDQATADAVERAAKLTGTRPKPVLTYLATTLRHGDREVPYSLVTALDLDLIERGAGMTEQTGARDAATPPILLNDWTARELAAGPGDLVSLDYYVWQEPGSLETRRAEFQVRAVVPMAGYAADRSLVPEYPGITGAESVSDWDPPFPIDLKRVRPADEDYWKRFRTTPKAFIPFEAGQALWRTRYGDRTSIRLPLSGQTLSAARDRLERQLTANLDPLRMGFTVWAARAEGLRASRGSTDFGEYFVYFSFFLVASALVLAALFFRLGVEQRAREVGLLRAVGFGMPRIRRLFAAEGLALAVIGSLAGAAGAVAYGAAMMAGLRTWWSGAVGTKALTLHVSAVSLLGGAAGAVIAALVCVWWTLHGLGRVSERNLLAGNMAEGTSMRASRRGGAANARARGAAIVFAAIGVSLIAGAALGKVDPAGAFFGAGASILIACLAWLASRLRRSVASTPLSVTRLGFRNTSERPGRTVFAVAVIGSAAFILVSVDAFRRDAADAAERHSGTGGYPLLVDLMLPIVHDPNTRDGRDTLALPAAANVTIETFRVLPGDDASCLNLYEPRTPRILGASRRFIDAGRFAFQSSAASDAATRANPWLLLNTTFADSAVPVIADANSMTYVLHKQLGDDIVIPHGGAEVRLRIVAALSDSIFQRELIMSDANFVRLFPEQQGYRFLLIDAPAGEAPGVATAIERGAADLGADAVSTSERLAEFHAVENTYLTTFQTLGGLGLLVGTVGLAAVLLRNVLERRRELALLRAVGYGRLHLFAIVFSENIALLVWGLGAGALSAAIAVAPTALERGARLPLSRAGMLLLVAVLVAGLISSAIATRAALRWPLVAALRSE